MSQLQQAILLLIIGWLFGLLSPAIVDAIKLRRENIRGRAAIKAELEQLCEILVFAAFKARKAAGSLDHPFLEWLRSNLKRDKSSAAASLRAAVEAGLSTTPEDLAKVADFMATPPDKVTVLQHYPAPLLDARVAALWSFETDYQRQLLEIHKDLMLLSDIVRQSREFFQLTFSVSAANHDLLAGNLRQSYENYAERAKIVVDHVRRLK
ncbi:hypothetical protein [Lysobacter sp. Root494]|uniref:hypothetical protein n=1 Tax=Lysobacter sp. Root494 TaxID=1736549 RepID=UPI0006FDEDBC|nr:hypothetical protein [Lysobacter sp. Root494]KQY54399.1 hypothetical protein ASD14_15550 [Lysobacter sp. Root494]